MEFNDNEPNPLNFGQQIKTGLDGLLYMVFRHAVDLGDYMRADPMKRYEGKQICCFGQLDNAVCVNSSPVSRKISESTMTRPKALDLFCCAGGASTGLHRAGFDVVGVDIAPQPRYPFTFIQADATRPPLDLRQFDFIWASPTCQKHTAMKTMHNAKAHPDHIPATRSLLKASGVLYSIENVVGAPLVDSVILCGSMFGLGAGGAQLRRHRQFEANFPIDPPACDHRKVPTIGLYGGHVRNRKRREGSHARGVADFTNAQGREAMGIDWMTLMEMSEAIPPAYAEFIGRAALEQISAVKQAAE